MKGLDERLIQVAEKRNEKQLIETHLSGILVKLRDHQDELAALSIELDALDDLLQEEDSQLNISKLFQRILGNPEQQKERERQTYLMTYLKHNDLEQRIQAKEYEIAVLEKKLTSFTGVDDLYKKLLKEKTQQLKYRHKDLATEIILLETAIRKQEYQQLQIKQAEEIGSELLQLLNDLYDGLIEVSTLDTMHTTEFRNNRVVIFVSRKKRKEAKSLQQTLQIISRTCETFTDELNDVSVRFKLDYKPFIPQVSQFLEYFYDGYISDWIRRSKLKLSLNQIDMTQAKVDRIMDMLEHDMSISQTSHDELKSKLERIVLYKKI